MNKDLELLTLTMFVASMAELAAMGHDKPLEEIAVRALLAMELKLKHVDQNRELMRGLFEKAAEVIMEHREEFGAAAEAIWSLVEEIEES